MTAPLPLRVLRWGGAVLLLGFTGVLVASYGAAGDPSGWNTGGEFLEVGGVIAGYAHDAVIVSTEGGLRYTLRVSPATVVRDGTAPATLAALRPGRLAGVTGSTSRAGRTLDVRSLMVWGGDRGSP